VTFTSGVDAVDGKSLTR